MAKLWKILFISILQYSACTFGFTSLNDFKYTKVSWLDGRMKATKCNTFPDEVHSESIWPSGPYAMLMPTTGCPETEQQGWRTGYINFVWQTAHRLFSSLSTAKNGCKMILKNHTIGDTNETITNWINDITEGNWPETCSSLLSPFNKFSFKMNFCEKAEDANNSTNENVGWPEGNYSIIAAGECVTDFFRKKHSIKLPKLLTWSKKGFLPNVTVIETDNLTIIELDLCVHGEANAQNKSREILYTNDAFILIKEENRKCTDIKGMDMMTETLFMEEYQGNLHMLEELFQICYYIPCTWMNTNELNSCNKSDVPIPIEGLAITNVGITYGTHDSMGNNLKHYDTLMNQGISNRHTTLWLLLDMGRMMTVQGLIVHNLQENQPFTKVLIGNDRFAILRGGAKVIPQKAEIPFIHFLKKMYGRYILLVTSNRNDIAEFRNRTADILVVVPHLHLPHKQKMCNNDLGMQSYSITDAQLSSSSWLPKFPLEAARPFLSGWCADITDTNHFIMIDLLRDTTVEGIVVWNWETLVTSVNGMVFSKRYLPMGAKKFRVFYRTTENGTWMSEKNGGTFHFELFHPSDEPQMFIFEELVYARFVKVIILQPMTEGFNCLRFELIGCQYNDVANFPPLYNLYSYEFTKIALTKQVFEETVLTSANFPSFYQLGADYSWLIDFKGEGFVKLEFTKISFNVYQNVESNQNMCKDKIRIFDGMDTSGVNWITVDHLFNNRTSDFETKNSIILLTFTTCRTFSQTVYRGSGFRVAITKQAKPTCFSFGNFASSSIIEKKQQCAMPSMYLVSSSVLNIPFRGSSESWMFHVKKHTFKLEFQEFFIHCDKETTFKLTDRYVDDQHFCNLARPPNVINTNSDTVSIVFSAASYELEYVYSVRQRFKAAYTAFGEDITKTDMVQWTNLHAVMKFSVYERDGEPDYVNSTFFAYKACSSTFKKCYSILSGATVSWKMAGYECWIRKKRLVSFSSLEELQLVKRMLRNFRYVDVGLYTIDTIYRYDNPDPYYYSHIGLYKSRNNKGVVHHTWENGSPPTFTAWNIDEPSDKGDCVRMSFHLGHYNATWESEDCEKGMANYFVCEQEKTKSTIILSNYEPDKYNGTMNKTINGLPCQRWDSNFPHRHNNHNPVLYPEDNVRDAHNYCRDPDRSGYLWCYTTDPNVRFEECASYDYDEVVPHLYTGKLSKTASGKTCQRWDSDYPHEKYAGVNENVLPDETLADASNYCRDPYYQSTLWCMTTDPDTFIENCFFFETASDRCYTNHFSYIGWQNETISGKTCQYWNETTPHDHEPFSDLQFPDKSVSEAKNFCRDPYSEGYLWCFTTVPGTRTEPCLFDYKYQLGNPDKSMHRFKKQFVCENGIVIQNEQVCNGKVDCVEVSDETNCSREHTLLQTKTMPNLQTPSILSGKLFHCGSQELVLIIARCDGVIDCVDASDEMNCTNTSQDTPCSYNHFECRTGGCIHISQMCDFLVDCPDATDENCDHPLCSTLEYRCTNGQCIPSEQRCDAYTQCIDGTDERNCDVCNDGTFHCDKVRCIPSRLVCDKYPDCEDRTDEERCVQPSYNSCEDIWTAGYERSGFYKLNDADIECDFSKVKTEGKIYTIDHNYNLVKQNGDLMIHSYRNETTQELVESLFDILTSSNHTCQQTITQTCTPAQRVIKLADNEEEEGYFNHCKCIVMTIRPFLRYNSPVVHYCDEITANVPNQEILFEYQEKLVFNEQYFITRKIKVKTYVENLIEVKVGPAVCISNANDISKNMGCDCGSKSFDKIIRCVYKQDHAGFMIGCRAGAHLENCQSFKCPPNTVKCPNDFCLPLEYICDGEKQCPGGEDEADCGCFGEHNEVVLMTKNGDFDETYLKYLAKQFSSEQSVFRVLRYTTRKDVTKLDFDHLFLDISDTVSNPYDVINREYVCRYTIIASDFINTLQFTSNNSQGLIFLQKSEEAKLVAEYMFKNIKTAPNFHMYRVVENLNVTHSKSDSFPHVIEVSVKRWSHLITIGSTFFPNECEKRTAMMCPNEFKCIASTKCISMDQVCDGTAQCFSHDDEIMCEFLCPDSCNCEGFSVDCRFGNISFELLHNRTRLLDISGNTRVFYGYIHHPLVGVPYLVTLNLSNCKIYDIFQNNFRHLNNLLFLDLSFNHISVIHTSAFLGLQRLKVLRLNGNKNIAVIETRAFQGLVSIMDLEITGSAINRISSYAFHGLKLDSLTLSNNTIDQFDNFAFGQLIANFLDFKSSVVTKFDKDLFAELFELKKLWTPAFKFCCVRPKYLSENDCTPGKDDFSSCDDLMRITALQIMIWIMGICALVGNFFSIVYRFVFDRTKFKIGYGIFVTNLAIADFFMGVYLMIIAAADTFYRKRYIFMDDTWRASSWCTLSGVLSTISSEAGVFFLCFITLDRFIIITYPFSKFRITSKKAIVLSIFAWIISVFISVFPLVHESYFQNRFYTKSGVCIALPLTRDRPPGWMYSIVIFLGLNFITFILIAVGQLLIYVEIKRVSGGIAMGKSMKMKSKSRRAELAVARNLLFVVSTDFLCWFPIGCMGLMALSGHVIPGEVYAWTAVFILPVNSAINPFLYTLTAIVGKMKQRSKSEESGRYSRETFVSQRHKRNLSRLFRYYMAPNGQFNQTFISLEDAMCSDVDVTRDVICKMAYELIKCICLLQNNSLSVSKLHDKTVYTNIENGRITGDIYLRREPIMSLSNETKSEDIYKYGVLLRSLLSRLSLLRKIATDSCLTIDLSSNPYQSDTA